MMLDDRIALVQKLIAQREEIDRQLNELFAGGVAAARKPVKCSSCGQEGHNAKTCPTRPPIGQTTANSE